MRFFDERLSDLNLYVEKCVRTQTHWLLESAWITINGDWNTAPPVVKDWYPWGNLGGDHHAYGMCYEADRDEFGGFVGTWHIAAEAGFGLLWPEDGHLAVTTDSEPYEWANAELYAGYDHKAGHVGPYNWQKIGNSDLLVGLGMPYPPLPWQEVAAMGGVHVSFFGVWREMPPEVDPPGPSPSPSPSPSPGPEPSEWEDYWVKLWFFPKLPVKLMPRE